MNASRLVGTIVIYIMIFLSSLQINPGHFFKTYTIAFFNDEQHNISANRQIYLLMERKRQAYSLLKSDHSLLHDSQNN
jgi:hypothetical protein